MDMKVLIDQHIELLEKRSSANVITNHQLLSHLLRVTSVKNAPSQVSAATFAASSLIVCK